MSNLKSLVSRAIREKYGDSLAKTAFTELVKKYQDMVFGLVYAILQDHFPQLKRGTGTDQPIELSLVPPALHFGKHVAQGGFDNSRIISAVEFIQRQAVGIEIHMDLDERLE